MIRKAREQDKNRVEELWKQCFCDTEGYIRWWFDNMYKPENTIVCEDDGEIAGALQMVDYTLEMGGKDYDLLYLCGVSVFPQYRGRAIAQKLLACAEKEGRKRNKAYLILNSDLTGFYEKYGFYKCFGRKEYSFDASDFKGTGIAIKEKACGNDDEFFKIYSEYIKSFDAYIKRSRKDMKRIINSFKAEGSKTILLEDAYILCDVSENNCQIAEMAYIGRNGFENIMNYLCENMKRVTVKTAKKSPLSEYFKGIDNEQVMVRDLNGKPAVDIENDFVNII